MTSKLDLNDYYKWASGNLADNRNRGIFAEWLVGKALNTLQEEDTRVEWDGVDLRYKNLGIEIKASGRSQTWDPQTATVPRFGIPKNSRAWDSEKETVDVFDPPRRNADIYIFCLHQSVPATKENVADPESWSFWVVATHMINEKLGDQKSLGVSTLNELTGAVTWSGIAAEIKRVTETNTYQ